MKSSIAEIHIAKSQLGLDDDTYRAKLRNITGKSSTKEMDEHERQHVLRALVSEGFKPKAKRRSDGRLKLSGRYAGKLQALWIAGWNLGIFNNRDDAALEAFVKRQTGLDAVRFCRDAVDARKAIEALKAILARQGGVDWNSGTSLYAGEFPDLFRIAYAQHRLVTAPAGHWLVFRELLKKEKIATDYTKAEWIQIMNILGERIRAEKKAGP